LTRIFTANYLVSGDAPPIEGGALLAREGKICARGKVKDLKPDFPEAEVVDFGEALLVPLLINAHTHLELTDYPKWALETGHTDEPAGFIDWILQLIKIKSQLKIADYQASLAHGIALSIASGTGAVGDILAHHAVRTAYQKSSLSGCLFLETLGHDPAMIQRLNNRLDIALQETIDSPVKLGLSPHSPYTISAEYLKQIYARCKRDGLRCTTHLAESSEEVDFIESGRGPFASRFYPQIGWENYIPRTSFCRPAEYLEQQGGLFPGNLLVHGVQLNNTEIALLGRKQMHLALCPRSNARLNVGKAPAGKLLAAGVNLALGTDSLASCESLSIWDEMTFAHRWFAGELDAPTLFQLATSGGAKALGVENQLGSLSVGKTAGFQVLRPETPVAENEIFDYFFSPECPRDIDQIYHHGKPQLSGQHKQVTLK
jgi:cytosine/adenosine deaminase-related metal-dependent hydrolase